MKIIAVAAVTGGGKTTLVRELLRRLPNAASLHFDDYTFEGEVENFGQWVRDGADYEVWNLSPLVRDIEVLQSDNAYDYLLLDYPFAYCHSALRPYIDCAIFLDTPLDIAMARRVLRDMTDASGDDIRREMEHYLTRARSAYLQMHKDILPSSDHVLDGAKPLGDLIEDVQRILSAL